MKPLRTNQRVLIWLCAYPTEDLDGKRENLTHIIFTILVFVVYIIFLAASIGYFVKFSTIDLNETLYATIQIAAALPMMKALVIMIFRRHKFRELFESLSKIYDESEKDGWVELFDKVNGKCEWMWQIYFKCVIGGFYAGIISMSTCSVAVSWMIEGKYDEKIAYHPYKFLFPWNQQTLIGYLVEKMFDLLIGSTYFVALGAVLLLFISLCMHHHTFYTMFNQSVNKIIQENQRKSAHSQICHLIRMHSTIKDLFWDSANIYSSFVFAQLILSIIHLACAIFEMDLQLQQSSDDIITAMYTTGFLIQAMMLSGSIMFIYCYFGEMATESFECLADCLYESHWQNLHVKLQKYFILMIMNAQTPLFYHGFHITHLSLETFSQLIKSVFTYYMMFKTITSD